VRLDEPVLSAELGNRLFAGAGVAVGPGVVGDQPLDPRDAVGGEVGGGAEQERRTGGAGLVGQDFGVGEPGVVVDYRVDVVVADLGQPCLFGLGGWSAVRASRPRRGSCRSSSRAPAPRAGPAGSGRRSAWRTRSAGRSTDRSQPGRAAGGGAVSATPCGPARRARPPVSPALGGACAELLPPRPRRPGWSASDYAAVATTGPAAPLRPRRHSGRSSGAPTAVTPRLLLRHGQPDDPMTPDQPAADGHALSSRHYGGHEDLRVVKT
jgi:hypothetical protein